MIGYVVRRTNMAEVKDRAKQSKIGLIKKWHPKTVSTSQKRRETAKEAYSNYQEIDESKDLTTEQKQKIERRKQNVAKW